MEPTFSVPHHVVKDWGYEDWLCNNSLYCGKILMMNANSNFSMHYHMKKDESWYILSGKMRFNWIDTKTSAQHTAILSQGDVCHIPPGLPHQLIAIETTHVIETSTEHFETDSHRVWREVR
jgi:mannose-6-phosphate isomerase-like protein (cupin superfamily)